MFILLIFFMGCKGELSHEKKLITTGLWCGMEKQNYFELRFTSDSIYSNDSNLGCNVPIGLYEFSEGMLKYKFGHYRIVMKDGFMDMIGEDEKHRLYHLYDWKTDSTDAWICRLNRRAAYIESIAMPCIIEHDSLILDDEIIIEKELGNRD